MLDEIEKLLVLEHKRITLEYHIRTKNRVKLDCYISIQDITLGIFRVKMRYKIRK